MAAVLLTDIDGTLVNSNTLHAEAWRRTIGHFSIEIGLNVLLHFMDPLYVDDLEFASNRTLLLLD